MYLPKWPTTEGPYAVLLIRKGSIRLRNWSSEGLDSLESLPNKLLAIES